MSSKDDKRILENKIDTLAYGHYMNGMNGHSWEYIWVQAIMTRLELMFKIV